ncbi:hypothetical protein, partial [Alloprevotella sp. OH1205_COT-284]|uniref:hypothetical protein n=1 Tax=Alloprevotella sp. OH1205_COT-284 TaxID=2491043 RepID=UPI0013159426
KAPTPKGEILPKSGLVKGKILINRLSFSHLYDRPPGLPSLAFTITTLTFNTLTPNAKAAKAKTHYKGHARTRA